MQKKQIWDCSEHATHLCRVVENNTRSRLHQEEGLAESKVKMHEELRQFGEELQV